MSKLRQTAFELLSQLGSSVKDDEGIESFEISESSVEDLECPEGNHELGRGRWINANEYININERCDSCIYFIKDNPEIKAISTAHYHRRGWQHGIRVYIK